MEGQAPQPNVLAEQPVVNPAMQQAAPMANAQPAQPSFFESINAVELLLGIGLFTTMCFGIYYFKTQTKTVNPAIQTMNERIDKIDSDLAKVEEVVMPQQ